MRCRILLELAGLFLIILSILYIHCGDDDSMTAPVPVGETRLLSYSQSDCLLKASPGDFIHTMSDSADVEIIVDGLQVTVIHGNAYFNCCIDSIQVEFFQDAELLKLTEKDVYTNLCRCDCVYEVTTVLEVVSHGLYVIEIWAVDRLIWRGDIVV